MIDPCKLLMRIFVCAVRSHVPDNSFSGHLLWGWAWIAPSSLACFARIYLSHGQLNLVQEGAVYPCTVESIRDYGAMVRLDSGQEMLLHISELADHRVGSTNTLMLTQQVSGDLENLFDHLATMVICRPSKSLTLLCWHLNIWGALSFYCKCHAIMPADFLTESNVCEGFNDLIDPLVCPYTSHLFPWMRKTPNVCFCN